MKKWLSDEEREIFRYESIGRLTDCPAWRRRRLNNNLIQLRGYMTELARCWKEYGGEGFGTDEDGAQLAMAHCLASFVIHTIDTIYDDKEFLKAVSEKAINA